MLREITEAHITDMICAFGIFLLTITLYFTANCRLEVIFEVCNIIMHIRFRIIFT